MPCLRGKGQVSKSKEGTMKRARRMNNAQRLKLLLQPFLLVLSSFLFSFLFSHWFLLGGPGAQSHHHEKIVGIGN
jgi:hypothetical protein